MDIAIAMAIAIAKGTTLLSLLLACVCVWLLMLISFSVSPELLELLHLGLVPLPGRLGELIDAGVAHEHRAVLVGHHLLFTVLWWFSCVCVCVCFRVGLNE